MTLISFKRLAGCLATVVLGTAALPDAASAADPTPCSFKIFKKFGPRLQPNTFTLQFTFDPGTLPALQPGTNIRYDRVRFERRLLSGANTWSYARSRCEPPLSGGVGLSVRSFESDQRAGVRDGSSVIELGSQITVNRACMAKVLACATFWVEGDPSPLPGEGTIAESDIQFNDEVRWWTGLREVPESASGPGPGNEVYDLWSVAAHEFGHSIGFNHVSEDPDAPSWVRAQMMYYSIGSKVEKRYLMGSDYEALCTLYPCF